MISSEHRKLDNAAGTSRTRRQQFCAGLGTYATVFDACRPCYSYRKFYVSSNNIIYSQCDAAYPVSRLSKLSKHDTTERDLPVAGVSGEGAGCFPMYLDSKLENGEILISATDLQTKREYFELTKEEP